MDSLEKEFLIARLRVYLSYKEPESQMKTIFFFDENKIGYVDVIDNEINDLTGNNFISIRKDIFKSYLLKVLNKDEYLIYWLTDIESLNNEFTSERLDL